MTLGARIRQARQLKGLEQDEFGQLVSTSQQQVSLWELDKSVPRKLPLIASVLGTSIDWLKHGVGDPPTEQPGEQTLTEDLENAAIPVPGTGQVLVSKRLWQNLLEDRKKVVGIQKLLAGGGLTPACEIDRSSMLINL